MYLKRVEIFGFKSFADKTVLNFERGITAVVGPNGCGKSNIFDAIRWVLGEQSMKELRGTAKEDVIFNGTNSREPLSFAEVSLTFSNEDKALPVEYDEVTVARRLFRSGESEYLMNKVVVRLKDILELFMGTGVGAEAYSLVQQGKVDLVVSAHPEDRRLIFDEASGITKYKSKKREALNKLQDTDNNLLRSNDIIIEVKRQIASIERQAQKAQRYKEELERLKVMEFIFTQEKMTQFERDRSGIEETLSHFKEQDAAALQELEKLSALLSQESQALGDVERRTNALHQDDIKLENQIDIENRQINFNQERVAAIDAYQLKVDEQKKQIEERCRAQEEKIAVFNEEFRALKETIAKNADQLTSHKADLTKLEEHLHATKAAIKKEEEEVLNLSAHQVDIKNSQTEIMKDFQGALARKRRLDSESDKVSLEKEAIDQRLQEVNVSLETCQARIDELKTQQGAAQGHLEQLKENLRGLDQTIAERRQRKSGLESRRDFIQEMRVQYEDSSDPVARGVLWTSHPPSTDIKGMIGKICEVKRLEGSDLATAQRYFPAMADLFEVSCETKYIELDPEQITAKIDELSVQIEAHHAERNQLLGQMAMSDVEISRFSSLVHEQEREFSKREADKANVVSEATKLSEEISLINQELTETKGILADLKSREGDLHQQLMAVEGQIEYLKGAIRKQQADIVLNSQKREKLLLEIMQMETELAAFQEKEARHAETLRLFEGALADGRNEIARLEAEAVERANDRVQYLKANDEIQAKIEELKVSWQALKKAIADHDQEREAIVQRIAELRPQIQEAEKQLEGLRSRAHAQELRNQEIAFHEQSLKDKLAQTYRLDFDAIVKPVEEGSLESLEVADLSNLNPDQHQELLQREKDKASLKAFKERLAQMQNDVARETLAQDIEHLRKRCESYGAVNLVAIDEYEELKQRFEFLTKQQSDLLEAKQSLMSTIEKINRTTRQLFLDTFTKVSEEFRIYFRMLFGGGEADLILVDPENVLECGIDIIARPPGKKLQNISLMSGGEKTMAAIALIFAVFKVRPSPFCVLDEIDAALDESNVGRYSYLLQEFSKISQFIVITHNKKTINSADIMYGITMQERGVSKIVSVRLTEEEKAESTEQVPAGV